jgi:hypothetical protein
MTHVVNATTEPGDKSMAPVRMTNVAPIATIAVLLTCSDTFIRFWDVRKRSVVRLTANMARSRAAAGPTICERKSLLTVLFIGYLSESA